MKGSSPEKTSQQEEEVNNTSTCSEASEGGEDSYRSMPFPGHNYFADSPFDRPGSPPEDLSLFEKRVNVSDFSNCFYRGYERHVNNIEVRYAVDYIQKIRSHYPYESTVFKRFLEVMKDFRQGKITTEDITKAISFLFRDHEALVSEFRKFLPYGLSQIVKCSSMERDGHKMLGQKHEKMDKDKAVEFVTLAKQRFSGDEEVYTKFIKLLAHLKNKPIPEGKFRELEILLMDYPDLLFHLHKFIPDNAIVKEDENSPFNIISKKMKRRGVYEEFVKCINAFNQNLISGKDLIFVVTPLLGDEGLVSELKRYMRYDDMDEMTSFTPKKMKLLKKIGSYRILPEERRVRYETNGDVLNSICIGCPTHEREDEQYVFLKRSVHEENMFRIEDERFEADLLISRCDTLIISLEAILRMLEAGRIEGEVPIEELGLSLGIVQEFLEFIYKSFSEDVFDGILTKPRRIIPLVLNRLYLVNRRWRNERAMKNTIWDEAVRKNHYKALDSMYHDFKRSNKRSLSYKSLSQNMVGRHKVDDLEALELVSDIVRIHEENWCANGNGIFGVVYPFIDLFKKQELVFYGNPVIFSVISYILILYNIIKEVKELHLPSLTCSKLAASIGILQHKDVEDRKEEIFNILRDFVAGKIETWKYEEEIRILSDGHGYKLLSIDKILGRLGIKVTCIRQDSRIQKILNEIYENDSKLESIEMLEESGENYKFSMKEGELDISKIIYNPYVEALESIEKFKNLEFDEHLVKNKVFLKRNFVEFRGGRHYFNMEHRICLKTMKLRYISGTEDFFMRAGIRRCGAV